MKKFSGKTSDQEGVPILGAPFWKKGFTLTGVVRRRFDTANGPCHEIQTDKPVTVNGEAESIVAVGNMKGFNMAVNAAGLESLEPNDKVKITCVGQTDTGKGSPRIDFQVEVER